MVWPYTVFRYDRHGDKRPARIGSACSVIARSVKLHMGRQPQEDVGIWMDLWILARESACEFSCEWAVSSLQVKSEAVFLSVKVLVRSHSYWVIG